MLALTQLIRRSNIQVPHVGFSGIVHMLRIGARWRDCPEVYGPYTTIYNRFNRWEL